MAKLKLTRSVVDGATPEQAAELRMPGCPGFLCETKTAPKQRPWTVSRKAAVAYLGFFDHDRAKADAVPQPSRETLGPLVRRIGIRGSAVAAHAVRRLGLNPSPSFLAPNRA